MTETEASEVILHGKFREPCPACKMVGEQLIGNRAHKILYLGRIDNRFSFYRTCKLCSGRGVRFRSEYLIACVTLHLPFPSDDP